MLVAGTGGCAVVPTCSASALASGNLGESVSLVADESSLAVRVPVAVSLAFPQVLASVNFVAEEPSPSVGLFHTVVPGLPASAGASGNLGVAVPLHASESRLAVGVSVTVSFTQLEAVLASSVHAVAIESVLRLNAVVPVTPAHAAASGNPGESVSLVADEALFALAVAVTVSFAYIEAMPATGGSVDVLSVKFIGDSTTGGFRGGTAPSVVHTAPFSSVPVITVLSLLLAVPATAASESSSGGGFSSPSSERKRPGVGGEADSVADDFGVVAAIISVIEFRASSSVAVVPTASETTTTVVVSVTVTISVTDVTASTVFSSAPCGGHSC